MQSNSSKSISLACLTALWGLAATPQSLAACDNAQRAITLRWDPVLRQQWLTTTDCNHPERPAQAKLSFSAIPLHQTIARPSAPLAVHAGDRVRLWSQQNNTRMELTGTAEESGAIGSTIHIRLSQSPSSENEPELQGIVRGPSEAELKQ